MTSRRHGSFDAFEAVMFAFGILFLLLAGLCLFATISLIVAFNDQDPGFPAGQDFQQVIKGIGIGLFGVGTIVMFGVSSHFLGDRAQRRWRALFRRRPRGSTGPDGPAD